MKSLNPACIVLLLFMASACLAANASGQTSLFRIAGEPVTFTGSMRTRNYTWSFFNPGPVPNGRNQNEYDYQANVLRLGLGYQRRGVKVFAEMMNPSLFSLPSRALAPPPAGALGLGANYFQMSQSSATSTIFLKQAYIELENKLLKGLDIKGGRLDFFEGADLIPQDPQLRWLALNEIQHRLIGNFGWSDGMRSFDGATARYGNKNWNTTLMYGIPTQGVFNLHGMDEIKRVSVAYGALNVGPNTTWGNSLGRIFFIHYEDHRGLVPVDNELRPAANRSAIRIETIGADVARTIHYGPGTLDALAWVAYQFGSWGNEAQRAEAFTVQLGYRFNEVQGHPWLRALYTFASGDQNPNDGSHGTFFQVLPTPRIYALDPFYNMMNIKDAGVELMLQPLKSVTWRTTVHGLWLASNNDRWYAGGGAFNNSLFGYVAHPSYGHSHLATVVDTGPTWNIHHHLALSFYVGHAFGGPVVAANFPAGRQETLAYVESLLSF